MNILATYNGFGRHVAQLSHNCVRICSLATRVGSVLCLAALLLPAPFARAGLTLEIDLYRDSQGSAYAFYTPLLTNAIAPAAALGTYVVRSPEWPTNGSQRGFDLTTNGISDRYELDSEYGYGDFNSAMFQITNGTWSILFTNATTTNVFAFTASAPTASSNMLPATLNIFPVDGSVILSSQTNFTWQAPAGWTASVNAQVYDDDGYYQFASLPAGQTNWNVDSSLPADTNFTFSLQYLTTNSLVSFTQPLNTNNAQPISGWASFTVLETGSSVGFDLTATRAAPSSGHTCFAYYSFEDNNLFANDFSGNGNTLTYSWFTVPPVIVTNDAAAGTYAAGFGGSGWFDAPDTLNSVFSGSFSVSLWLKTTNVFGSASADEYSAAGIVSALGNDYGTGVLPMGQAGNRLVFYTGGSLLNLLYSQASINVGQYVHLVVTRDQQTGEKRIYVNGVLDSAVYSDTDMLVAPGSGQPTIGYNNGNVFTGEMDEIQFYSGVLSSNEVAFLHSHPGSKVADTVELSVPVGRYDFENTNLPGADSSGHGNDADYYEGGSPADIPSTDAAVGLYARQFFGATSYAFTSGSQEFPNLSNALAGSFSVTAWVNTTNSVNSDDANAYYGLPILFLYNSDTNSTIPLSITGSKAAFTIYDENGNAVTLHSLTTVNDGNYHCLAVTRDMPSGQMNLYVDGNLEATGTSSKQFLQIPWIHLAGGYYVSYVGLLDDVRIYGGVLSPDDVATLAAQGGSALNTALGTSGLNWTTSGDANWFVETTNTYNGEAAAAQSGSVTGNQVSTLSVAVTGPGTLTFAWSSIANDPNGGFDYEFDLDGGYMDNITGDTAWYQDGQFIIPAGQHTLSWTVSANGDSDPTQAGFLDQVNYTVLSLSVTESPTSGQAPLTVQFTSPGVDSGGNTVTSWNWSFGDGGTSSAQSPSYTYTTAGSFSPSLTAYSTFGATPLFINGLGVISVSNGAPVITVNPFNQTNYPGYNVALYASASNSSAATWQWFKVGTGLIAAATNNLYIPTNSGTAGVAGSYYAIASNLVGSASTLTAAVTFVSAALPPDWSAAFASPLANNTTDATTNYNIACALDSTGNIYSSGSVTGTNTFGTNSLISINGNSGASILKQTAAGVPLWGRCVTNNGNGSSYSQCVVIAPSNGCYISGGIFGTNWLGTNLLVDTAGGSTFLARFDANGSNLWVRTISGTNGNFSEYHRLASDPAGNVTLSILASGTVSLGTTNVTITGQRGLLVQYDANGNVRWLQTPSGWPSFLTYQGGRIYGSMGGNGQLGGISTNYIGGVTNLSDRGQALFALNPTNGQAFWVQGIGGQLGVGDPGGFSDQDAVVGVSGTNVFVAGSAWGSNAAFGPFSVTFPAAKGQYLARYDTNGNPQLATAFGSQFTWPWAIAADTNGNVYIGGDFDTYSVFGNDIIAAPFYQTVQYIANNINDRIPGQGFIAKFDRNGNPLWARLAESQSSYLNLRDIALASNGVWGCGFFNQIATLGSFNIAGGITIEGSPIGTIVYHPDGYLGEISQSTALPVTLVNPLAGGGNFQLEFVSQSGFMHAILYRTNLISGNWQTYSNVAGDGTLKTIPVPLSLFSPSRQGFIRVSTQ